MEVLHPLDGPGCDALAANTKVELRIRCIFFVSFRCRVRPRTSTRAKSSAPRCLAGPGQARPTARVYARRSTGQRLRKASHYADRATTTGFRRRTTTRVPPVRSDRRSSIRVDTRRRHESPTSLRTVPRRSCSVEGISTIQYEPKAS
jgi:hypothetical protein